MHMWTKAHKPMTKMTQNVNVNLAFVFVSSNGKVYFS